VSAPLLAAALALAASLPLALLGWAAGAGAERLTADPGLRARVWSLALHLPLLAVAAAALGAAFAFQPEPTGSSAALIGEAVFESAAPAGTPLRAPFDPMPLATAALAVFGLGAGLLATTASGALAMADAARDAKPAARFGLHLTPQPVKADAARPVIRRPNWAERPGGRPSGGSTRPPRARRAYPGEQRSSLNWTGRLLSRATRARSPSAGACRPMAVR
jgi:hypothetical protein